MRIYLNTGITSFCEDGDLTKTLPLIVYKTGANIRNLVFLYFTRTSSTIKMKTIIVLIPILAIAVALPQHGGDADAQILRSESDNIGVDGYKFGFETSNGIVRDEQGTLHDVGTDHEAMEVHGSASHVDKDNTKVSITYVADKDGYRPQVSISH